MIRVRKPSSAPAILTTRGAAEKKKNCDEYVRHRGDYRNGKRTFEFDRAIYGGDAVKGALSKAQHEKCAFCESKITHVQYGDVEHFRPKKGFLRGGALIRPGYYWLAYDWDNLLLACQICNQRHKRNAFPLLRGSRRARSHLGSIANEKPKFVHPGEEDPTAEIGFRDHVPYPKNGSARGRATIHGLGLARRPLMDKRAERLDLIGALRDLARKSPPSPQRAKAEDLLRKAQEDDAEFAAMIRAFLAAP